MGWKIGLFLVLLLFLISGCSKAGVDKCLLADGDDQFYCWYDKAYLEKNPAHCDRLQVSDTHSVELARSLKNGCYYDTALLAQDLNACKKIKSDRFDNTDECITRIAVFFKDDSFCEQLQDFSNYGFNATTCKKHVAEGRYDGFEQGDKCFGNVLSSLDNSGISEHDCAELYGGYNVCVGHENYGIAICTRSRSCQTNSDCDKNQECVLDGYGGLCVNTVSESKAKKITCDPECTPRCQTKQGTNKKVLMARNCEENDGRFRCVPGEMIEDCTIGYGEHGTCESVNGDAKCVHRDCITDANCVCTDDDCEPPKGRTSCSGNSLETYACENNRCAPVIQSCTELNGKDSKCTDSSRGAYCTREFLV